ncbi:hypothetical protein HYH03_008532 [Edaphochlamys debaryana]|uniref:Uncharacterized protein n=1 Tax=Edaphochlamys debaryana TaxID=47281 RepID=A0A836BY33_9CHLO|nr:hypothetical protein HYH03_008532 [Edaphochlamys debaryana]|eukprot:KAG2493406.1 hypothetical protein HYH03_008532 [Edaphochlamys debaryana]
MAVSPKAVAGKDAHQHDMVLPAGDCEDEQARNTAGSERSGPAPTLGRAPSLRQAASFLRASFNASARLLRLGSVAGRRQEEPDPEPSVSAGPPVTPRATRAHRESQGFIGSLLSAVGIHHREPSRDASPSAEAGSGRSKLNTSNARTLARLSSAAMMRSELQNFSQFGDLRNDSFSRPAAVKLIKRGSMAGSEVAAAAAAAVAGSHSPPRKAPSRDLGRHSTNSSHLAPNGRVSATGAFAADPSSQRTPRQSTYDNGDGGGGGGGGGGTASSGDPGHHSRGSRSGSPAPLGRQSLNGAPRMISAVGPHPPSQPRPSGYGSPGHSRPGTGHKSPGHSRPGTGHKSPGHMRQPELSGEHHLPSVRDRPPTPRGERRASSSGSPSKLSKMLGSFRLPDIISGPGAGAVKTGVSEQRRGSVTGQAQSQLNSPMACNSPIAGSDVPALRARRMSSSNAAAGTGVGTSSGHIRGSGGSFIGLPGGACGPGAAAIVASAAKRAAAMAAANGVVPSGGSTSGALARPIPIPPPGVPSSVAPRLSSATVRPPPQSNGSGILQDFQSSLELGEDSALAAVEAEFDRRFGRTAGGVPGQADGGAGGGSERGTPTGPGTGPGAFARRSMVGPEHSSGGNALQPTSLYRQSANAALMGSGGGGMGACTPDESLLGTSLDGGRPQALNAKMRLASIRLSYADGLVGPGGVPQSGPVPGAVQTPSPDGTPLRHAAHAAHTALNATA